MTTTDNTLDALIIGAGISGIEQLHRLADIGWNVRAVEAGSGVGGTWYWNRYPGARVDSESYSYGYFFDRELREEWAWSEQFCGQPENERYLNRAVDKFGIRGLIQLDTTVASATFDADAERWQVVTTAGETMSPRFLITAIGILSAPQYPDVAGRDAFQGESYHTGRWPDGVDLTGKRVAVIGTGSSGVQLISSIAGDVAELTVFQRTPNWCTPLNNAPLTTAEMVEITRSYDQIWSSCQNIGGFVHNPLTESALAHTPDQRREVYERIWNQRGFAKLFANYLELLVVPEINLEFCAFLAEKIRARIDDPAVAAKLIPTDQYYGVKRPPYESNYFEVYNQPNVTLVDISQTPMTAVTATGITTSADEYEFDVIVYATGFNAISGSFDQIDVRGNGGATLKQKWANGPHTYVGTATPGFPNLFHVGGPQSLGGNIPRCVEKQVDFVTRLLSFGREGNFRHIEVGEAAAQGWVDHVADTVNATLFAAGDSWAFGSNTPGKPRAYGLYVGGMSLYAETLAKIAANDFEGFDFA